MSVCITGWAHNKFGVNLGQSSENMIADVVDKAIKHAEISVKDIAEFNDINANDVDQSDLTDEIANILDYCEKNNKEVA